VIKENRTYDQVLGDMPEGNGDPALCIFGAEITPNQHALAREFVLLDNTYCSGILSADGHNWSMAAVATDYLERSFAGFPRSYPDGIEDSGAAVNHPTPEACVADNDLALGRIVEALSKSRFWAKMAIFAIEDDPQNGWDHVSGYRTTCYLASPYARRGATVSTQYNSTSVLRTIGQILGLKPMNQFDASATPMADCFNDTPDLRPFTALPAAVPLDRMNPAPKKVREPALKAAALTSAAMDFTAVDKAPEDALNRVLWTVRKGPDVPYPEWAVTLVVDDDEDEDEETD
jgi:phospholipase C